MRSESKIKMMIGVAVVTTLTAGILVTAQAQPKPGTAASAVTAAYKPVQSVHQMMEGQNKLFKGIKDAIIDKSMKDAMVSAWVLAEIANSNQYQNEDAGYKALAVKMSAQCAELAETLKKGDEKAAMEKFSAIGNTCGACHDKFKKD